MSLKEVRVTDCSSGSSSVSPLISLQIPLYTSHSKRTRSGVHLKEMPPRLFLKDRFNVTGSLSGFPGSDPPTNPASSISIRGSSFSQTALLI